MKTNNLYPIFLKLDMLQTLIVGGGNVGLEKVRFITRQSPEAKIKIVSKEFHPEIIQYAINNDNIQLTKRAFINRDLENIKLLIIATNDEILNATILALANTKNILTNVVDNPPLCDFYTAAALKKGAIKIAISSNGVSPTLSKRLRDILDDVIPDEVNDTAHFLGRIRAKLTGNLDLKIKVLNRITSSLSLDDKYGKRIPDDQLSNNIHLN